VVDLAAARIHRKKILNGLINEYSQAAQPNHIPSGTGRSTHS